MGNWELGIGHWALGMGHWLFVICYLLLEKLLTTNYARCPMPDAPCPMPHARLPLIILAFLKA